MLSYLSNVFRINNYREGIPWKSVLSKLSVIYALKCEITVVIHCQWSSCTSRERVERYGRCWNCYSFTAKLRFARIYTRARRCAWECRLDSRKENSTVDRASISESVKTADYLSVVRAWERTGIAWGCSFILTAKIMRLIKSLTE